MTIMRSWHVKAAFEKADEYEKFMITKAVLIIPLLKVYKNYYFNEKMKKP